VKNENSTDLKDCDLFGNPLAPIRDRRGRPSFKITKENQDFVAVRAAANWTQKRIAEDMGIDEKTLRKNFSRELENGAIFMEGLALDILVKRMREGHTASIRMLRDILDPMPGSASKPTKEKEAAPLGKKEILAKAAKEPTAGWGGLLPNIDPIN